ncbi:MAG: ion transporter, partial [Alphaproteobacteria bacterium]|nr:ion transporter [Alphaproteobacteria bacterium]
MTMTKARIYEILNKADEGDRASMMVDRFLAILIIANLLAICLESVDSIYTVIGQYLQMFEVVSLAIFTIEYLVRLWCADANQSSLRKTSFGKRCEYIFSFTGLVDLIAILPSLIQLFLGGFDSRWVRLLRLVRILKISHYSSAFDDLGEAIYAERESFLAVLYLFAVSI